MQNTCHKISHFYGKNKKMMIDNLFSNKNNYLCKRFLNHIIMDEDPYPSYKKTEISAIL